MSPDPALRPSSALAAQSCYLGWTITYDAQAPLQSAWVADRATWRITAATPARLRTLIGLHFNQEWEAASAFPGEPHP